MTEKQVAKIIKQIADREGVSPQEVYDQIALAISTAQESPDPHVQNCWRDIPCKGSAPTVTESITYMAKNQDRPGKALQ